MLGFLLSMKPDYRQKSGHSVAVVECGNKYVVCDSNEESCVSLSNRNFVRNYNNWFVVSVTLVIAPYDSDIESSANTWKVHEFELRTLIDSIFVGQPSKARQITSYLTKEGFTVDDMSELIVNRDLYYNKLGEEDYDKIVNAIRN